MAGYIALTTLEWMNSIKHTKTSNAIFWCKKKNFKSIFCGEPIYLLQRGSFDSNADRFLIGKGTYDGFDILCLKMAWDKYGQLLGFSSFENLKKAMIVTYKSADINLGCILLRDLNFFDAPVSLSKCNVEFSKYIVSGKKISEEDCRKIDAITNR